METLNRVKTGKKSRPVRVVQFGEGNFLRAFVDYMIDIANEQGTFDGDIVLIKPIEFGNLDNFRAQECQYTVSLRGNVNGEGRKINRPNEAEIRRSRTRCCNYEIYETCRGRCLRKV